MFDLILPPIVVVFYRTFADQNESSAAALSVSHLTSLHLHRQHLRMEISLGLSDTQTSLVHSATVLKVNVYTAAAETSGGFQAYNGSYWRSKRIVLGKKGLNLSDDLCSSDKKQYVLI